MDIKRKISEAIEKLLPAYYQPDGTALKQGETLPAEDALHFQGWLQASISRYIGQNVVVELGDEDESIKVIPITLSGDRIEDQSVFTKYELGTRIDLDGDGK